MIKNTILGLIFTLSSMWISAENLTDYFSPIFSQATSKVKGGQIKGQKLKDRFDGMGVIRAKNGDIYFGDISDGYPHGRGVYITNDPNLIKDTDSIVFIGRYKNGVKSKGVCLNEESEVIFQGSFTDGCPDLKAAPQEDEYVNYFDILQSDSNDWVYIGEISQGVPHGKGIIIFNNGDFVISDFIYGDRKGVGLFMLANGEWQTEKYKNGSGNVISSSSYYAQIDSERKSTIRRQVNEALSLFAESLVTGTQLATQIAATAKGTPVSANDYGNSTISLISNDDGISSKGGGYSYEQQYLNWEKRAEQHYNSLTNLGISSTDKNGKKSGSTGQGMGGTDYVAKKKLFREAQKQMRSIRSKAAKEGISIPQSKWESATVSY